MKTQTLSRSLSLFSHSLLLGLLLALPGLHCAKKGATANTDPGVGPGPGDTASKQRWIKLTLLNEVTGDGTSLHHETDDAVNFIYFESLARGFIATSHWNYLNYSSRKASGAVFEASATSVKRLAVSGYQQVRFLAADLAKCGDATSYQASAQDLNFQHLFFDTSASQTTGHTTIVAATNRSDMLVVSQDSGQSFQVTPAGVYTDVSGQPGAPGLEKPMLYQRDAQGYWWMLRGTGIYQRSTEPQVAPGPCTRWTMIWAPELSPPQASNPATSMPRTIGSDECAKAPYNLAAYLYSYHYTFMSRATGSIIYPFRDTPAVCLYAPTEDKWRRYDLPANPAAIMNTLGPETLYFTSDSQGFAFRSYESLAGGVYIARTTDGGRSWAHTALPEVVKSQSLRLRDLFFAPGGQVGFAVGHYTSPTAPLLWRTDDAGVTWRDISPAVKLLFTDRPETKLHTGFALDSDNIWIGGEYSTLFHSQTGGL